MTLAVQAIWSFKGLISSNSNLHFVLYDNTVLSCKLSMYIANISKGFWRIEEVFGEWFDYV